MIQLEWLDGKIAHRNRRTAQVDEVPFRPGRVKRDRKIWHHHLTSQRLMQGARVAARIKSDGAFRIVQWTEKRNALDMIPMVMRKEKMDVPRCVSGILAQAHA